MNRARRGLRAPVAAPARGRARCSRARSAAALDEPRRWSSATPSRATSQLPVQARSSPATSWPTPSARPGQDDGRDRRAARRAPSGGPASGAASPISPSRSSTLALRPDGRVALTLDTTPAASSRSRSAAAPGSSSAARPRSTTTLAFAGEHLVFVGVRRACACSTPTAASARFGVADRGVRRLRHRRPPRALGAPTTACWSADVTEPAAGGARRRPVPAQRGRRSTTTSEPAPPPLRSRSGSGASPRPRAAAARVQVLERRTRLQPAAPLLGPRRPDPHASHVRLTERGYRALRKAVARERRRPGPRSRPRSDDGDRTADDILVLPALESRPWPRWWSAAWSRRSRMSSRRSWTRSATASAPRSPTSGGCRRPRSPAPCTATSAARWPRCATCATRRRRSSSAPPPSAASARSRA